MLKEVMNLQKSKYLLWLPAMIIMSLIFYLSSRERVPGPSIPDYLTHFTAYGSLAAAYYYPLRKTYGPSSAIIIIAFFLTSLYGISDEFHQSFVPGRDSSIKDWAVDSLAGFIIPFALNKTLLKS